LPWRRKRCTWCGGSRRREKRTIIAEINADEEDDGDDDEGNYDHHHHDDNPDGSAITHTARWVSEHREAHFMARSVSPWRFCVPPLSVRALWLKGTGFSPRFGSQSRGKARGEA